MHIIRKNSQNFSFVLQSRVLEHVLFTADIATSDNIFTATYANTVIMAAKDTQIEATNVLQRHLDNVVGWIQIKTSK